MSRIGKKPILIPEGVNVTCQNDEVLVSGPKGNLNLKLLPDIKAEISKGKIFVKRETDDKKNRAYHGLLRSLLANMILGVSGGFKKELELVGTGYRAQTSGEKLILFLGFTKPIEIPTSQGISFEVKENKIAVLGTDKTRVGQVAANIRALRPPEPYKGKGIRYVGEKIRKKAGKAGKAGASVTAK